MFARPLTDLVLVTLLALVWRGRALRLGCAAAWLAVLALPVQWVALPLENRFPRPAAPAHVDGVIVLGGAIETFISAERGIPTLNAAAERMTELVALAGADCACARAAPGSMELTRAMVAVSAPFARRLGPDRRMAPRVFGLVTGRRIATLVVGNSPGRGYVRSS